MSRNLPISNSPNKSQEVSVTLGCNGRTYVICDQGQMNFLLEQLRQEVRDQLAAAIKPTKQQMDAVMEEIAVVKKIKDKGTLRQMAMAYFDKTSEKQVEDLVQKNRELLPYATLDWILEKLPPDERQRWKDNYRFSGVRSVR